MTKNESHNLLRKIAFPLLIGLLAVLYPLLCVYIEKKTGTPVPCVHCLPCYPPQEGIWPDCHERQPR